MKYGLTDKTITSIQSCLADNPNIEEAVLYGSRAKGNFKSGSDIDLVLKGEELEFNDVLRLETALDDLLLPYKFDIALLRHIRNTDLLGHIHRVGVSFYQKALFEKVNSSQKA